MKFRYMHFITFSWILIFSFIQSAYAQKLSDIESFNFQLQNFTVSELVSSPTDLLIIDYSLDGSVNAELDEQDLITLKNSGKTVLSYFSIGEAEDYRFYFKRKWIKKSRGSACRRSLTEDSPRWLDKPNPNWCGNYKTRYWNRAWKRILFGKTSGKRKSYLDRIIDAGFDGVYLDIIDGFEYWENRRRLAKRRDLAKDMFTLVKQIAEYARITRGLTQFYVVPQNGSGIIERLSQADKEEYFSFISAIGSEDAFFYGDLDIDNEYNPQELVLSQLSEFLSAGVPVLAIEYLNDTSKISLFKQKACELGFVPQVADRNLEDLSFQALAGCS